MILKTTDGSRALIGTNLDRRKWAQTISLLLGK